LELFIGFHFEVGVVLPVGIRRGSCHRIQVENANAGALGKTLGSQVGVIEGDSTPSCESSAHESLMRACNMPWQPMVFWHSVSRQGEVADNGPAISVSKRHGSDMARAFL